MQYILQIVGKLAPFLWVTLFLSVISMLLGLFFGFILAIMKFRNGILGKIANVYINVMRSTPTIILLFLSYYGLPFLLEPIGVDTKSIDKKIFAIIALTLYCSAIISEILRPAYASVNKGQQEAALSVGLTYTQTFIHVVFPQAAYIALPNLGNMMIAIIHESALAYLIGVIDIMGQAKVINSMSYGANIIKIYLAVSILYWILSIIVGKTVDGVTFKMGKYLKL
ncbi:amino acid ABC transporter permease [Clostridium beijerinckii]|uniref:amino acid ABC transporter permease n=1 Tax=Clostridium beijerinckii TaxID=1520 RepID=UPI0015710D09|nr:amino acid ABC transporter permease [Clostridium beijerinckii]NRT71429.1 L-cystine transport system permease protein [Clostridium beijerinckii]